MCSNRCGCSGNDFNNFNTTSSSSCSSSYSGMVGSGFNASNYNNTNMNLGNAYVPNQILGRVFSPEEGLANGTMFPELVSPYYQNQSLQVMNYLRYNNRGGCCN